MFPSNGSMTRRPLPSPGSRWLLFPCFTGTMRRSDILPALPLRSVALAWRYRGCTRISLPRRRVQRRGPGVGKPVPHRPWSAETAGTPRFLGNPPVPLPCSSTPARPTRQALAARQHGPRYVHNEGSHDNNKPFGAQSHGLGTRCVRFVLSDATLASGCLPSSTGRDSHPQGSSERFQHVIHHMAFLLSQAFLAQGLALIIDPCCMKFPIGVR
jgi:hypothetical protein